MAIRLVFASNNEHKVNEILTLLDSRFEILTPARLGISIDIPETSDTFEGNARVKAQTLSRITGLPTFGDDSGLVVEALGGRPGVYSARYAGENASSQENCLKLMEALYGTANRKAAFICVIAFVHNEQTDFFRGSVQGRIHTAMRGVAGFGYDPLFVPNGYNQTFAQMPPELKNKLSHRGKAVNHFIGFLNEKYKTF